MKSFFDKNLLLKGKNAKFLYKMVKNLPIIDYHCHLNQSQIANDCGFSDIGELWLKADHYKWRAMRLNGVEEKYITGNATFKEKFFKYAEIMPNLIGNPLYYWTQLELKLVFNINKPLNLDTAEEIYNLANAKLKNLTVLDLLKRFNVEYVATTDDPIDDLLDHGKHGNTIVSPTFRPDKLFNFEQDYLDKLSSVSGVKINGLADLLTALENRLNYFVKKGCVISDHGFDRFPETYATEEQATKIFGNLNNASIEEKESLKGYILLWLTKEYKKRNITMQLHFAVTRNVNPSGFKNCGVDSGFDVVSEPPSVKNLVNFLNKTDDQDRPKTILYTLNDATLTALASVSGAFRNVLMGAAWWFNDTVQAIKRNLSVISEYACLGNNLGMLTDSRSFSSYVRFDFFRRILCSFVGEKVDSGEYDKKSAITLCKNLCYFNAKQII